MSNGNNRWREFWANRSDPIHQSNSDEFIARYAAELKIVIGDRPIGSVVEVGCGNGDMFIPLGFDKTRYIGYDFSPAMLAAFRQRFPKIEVREAPLQEASIDGKVDLVFSSGVIQNITLDDLRAHLKRTRDHLTPSGRIIHTSVTWKPARSAMFTRELFELPGNITMKSRLASIAIALGLKADPLGTWYDFSQLRQAGADVGLTCEIFGSLCYPYRCHVSYSLAPA